MVDRGEEKPKKNLLRNLKKNLRHAAGALVAVVLVRSEGEEISAPFVTNRARDDL